MNPDADRVHRITEHFVDLQGLRQVPFGVLLLLLTPVEMALPSGDGRRLPIAVLLLLLCITVAGFAAAFAAFRLTSAWYIRRYGVVQRTKRQQRKDRLVAVLGFVLFLIPFNFASSTWVSTGHGLPVNVVVLGFAAALAAYWWYLGRRAHHYLALAGLGLALGLVSVTGFPTATWPAHLEEATIYAGAAIVIGGLLDHRTLRAELTRSVDAVALKV